MYVVGDSTWVVLQRTVVLSGWCSMILPSPAEEVLDQFRDRFIKEVDAESVVGDLLHNNIIDEGDERDITSARNPTRQNEKLHLCLRRKCTLHALMTVCDIMAAVRGNPNMLALSELMKKRLETGACVSVCVCVCMHVCVLCVCMYMRACIGVCDNVYVSAMYIKSCALMYVHLFVVPWWCMSMPLSSRLFCVPLVLNNLIHTSIISHSLCIMYML